MKLTLDNLKRCKVTLNKVTIHSFDMSLYLVEVVVGQNKGMLRSENGQLLHFKSVEQVRNEMANFVVEYAQLQHKSPFDEMIGNPESAKHPLIIPLYW